MVRPARPPFRPLQIRVVSMSVYELARVPHITAGVGARERIGALAAEGGKTHALLVADPGLKATGLIEETAAQLRKSGLAPTIFDSFRSEPTIAQADAAAEIARREKADVVVCLGGGSALDLGKAVAAVATAPESGEFYQLSANPFPARGPVPDRCHGAPARAVLRKLLTRN